MTGIGIIGAGERGVYVIGTRIEESFADNGLYVHGIFDVNAARAAEGRDYLAGIRGRKPESIVLFRDLDSLLADDAITTVVITSYTSAHRDQALAALEAGKNVYLDKPIAATVQDALDIRRAERESGMPMMMGFTRRYEPAWRTARQQVESGAIGPVQMILLRSIIPYARYLQRWHRFGDLSGGALNDKCSHHFDVFRWFTSSEAVRVQATAGRSAAFAPDPDAPARCRLCDRECPYRVLPSDTVSGTGIVHRLDKDYQTVGATRWQQESWLNPASDSDIIDACVYHPDTDIWDYAVSTVTFASGAVATLFWNIFGPPADDQETLEIIGTSGRIVLERASGQVRVISGYGSSNETLYPDERLAGSHFGADAQLIRDISGLGGVGEPPASVSDGVEALRLVEATRRSASEGGRPVRMEEIPRAT